MTGRIVEVRLVGGPMNGRTMKVHKSTETISIGGFWHYDYGGKEDNQMCFVKREKKRSLKRLIRRHIERTSIHPGIEYERHKTLPFRKVIT